MAAAAEAARKKAAGVSSWADDEEGASSFLPSPRFVRWLMRRGRRRVLLLHEPCERGDGRRRRWPACRWRRYARQEASAEASEEGRRRRAQGAETEGEEGAAQEEGAGSDGVSQRSCREVKEGSDACV